MSSSQTTSRTREVPGMLAWRNLVYDKMRFAVTVTGIVFAVVLIVVEFGLFIGFKRRWTTRGAARGPAVYLLVKAAWTPPTLRLPARQDIHAPCLHV